MASKTSPLPFVRGRDVHSPPFLLSRGVWPLSLLHSLLSNLEVGHGGRDGPISIYEEMRRGNSDSCSLFRKLMLLTCVLLFSWEFFSRNEDSLLLSASLSETPFLAKSKLGQDSTSE